MSCAIVRACGVACPLVDGRAGIGPHRRRINALPEALDVENRVSPCGVPNDVLPASYHDPVDSGLISDIAELTGTAAALVALWQAFQKNL